MTNYGKDTEMDYNMEQGPYAQVGQIPLKYCIVLQNDTDIHFQVVSEFWQDSYDRAPLKVDALVVLML